MQATNWMSDEHIIAQTKRWLERAVIGLNLCPFAKAVHVKNQIRYVVCNSENGEDLLRTFIDELNHLQQTDSAITDTTLLIHPYVMNNFLDYNDFLFVADAAIVDAGLEADLQVASFHPQYQFADTEADDISNFTNRSPYPTLHILREASVTRAVAAFPEADEIFEKNIRTLQQLGKVAWDELEAGLGHQHEI